ncbi:hypothetical protein V8F33_003112 [Rhypophila sp. PSN 637]
MRGVLTGGHLSLSFVVGTWKTYFLIGAISGVMVFRLACIKAGGLAHLTTGKSLYCFCCELFILRTTKYTLLAGVVVTRWTGFPGISTAFYGTFGAYLIRSSMLECSSDRILLGPELIESDRNFRRLLAIDRKSSQQLAKLKLRTVVVIPYLFGPHDEEQGTSRISQELSTPRSLLPTGQAPKPG